MFINISSVIICIGGIVAYIFHKEFGLELNFALMCKILTAVLGGGGMALYKNIGLLKNIGSLVPNTKQAETKIFLPEDYEIKDFEAITHLRDRCVQAGSDEGVKICAQLAAVLFQLDTPKSK